LAGLELSITAENWSGELTVRSGIDGRVVNDGAALYKPFANLHLEPLSCGDAGDEGIHLLVRTNQSRLHVAIAARTRASIDGERIRPKVERIEEKRYIAEEIDVALEQGRRLSIEKIVALYTSRDPAISETRLAATKAIS